MGIPIIVINQPQASERRHFMRRQLHAAGLPCEILRGCDAQHGHARWFDGVDNDAFLLNTGRLATVGEIGCFASHKMAWQRCADSNTAVIVLEDDALLGAGFVPALGQVEQLIDRYGFIRLQSERKPMGRLPLLYSGEFLLVQLRRPALGAMAYGLNPQAARRLLAESRVFDAPVDVFLKQTFRHHQPVYGLEPYPTTPSRFAADSTIADRTRHDYPWRLRIRRLLAKAQRTLARAAFNRFHTPALSAAARDAQRKVATRRSMNCKASS